jgi:hypothetical protein
VACSRPHTQGQVEQRSLCGFLDTDTMSFLLSHWLSFSCHPFLLLFLSHCDQNTENNFQGGIVYFGSWFHRVQSMVAWPMSLGRTSWWQKHMAEDSCSPHGRQEAGKRLKKGPGQNTAPKDTLPTAYFVQRPHLLPFTTFQ